ncbi:MAG: DUF4214 domain-containing protein [Pseudomonadota bacterium]|nr:DUF4214 domain-containing protein [Pseudomonadota bacterium]
MSLLSSFGMTYDELAFWGDASLASFSPDRVPVGWSLVDLRGLGVDPARVNGSTYDYNGAQAVILENAGTYVVSFRGTDEQIDVAQYPGLYTGSYLENFRSLLQTLAANAPEGASFGFTGASLGGGAVNLMARVADNDYGGRFADARFVAFASPNITSENGILNVGFSNDPVYRLLAGYQNNPSSLDNLVLATGDYLDGNYDGRHPFDDYAHSEGETAFAAFARLGDSRFAERIDADSIVIFDASSREVSDQTPGREGIGALYIGDVGADQIRGRDGNDLIDGSFGNDRLIGGRGNDEIEGGAGLDTAVFAVSFSAAARSIAPDGRLQVASDEGADLLSGVERLAFTDKMLALDVGTGENAGVVYRTYQAAFDRTPDAAGLSFWIRSADQGASFETIAQGFIDSSEFRDAYGRNPTNQEFVGLLYENILGRPGETSGLDYWTDALAEGASRALVLTNFAESSENIALTAPAIGDGILLDPMAA